MSDLKVEPDKSKLVFVSISNVANGAEQLLLMTAGICKAPIIFLKKVKVQQLVLPKEQKAIYASRSNILKGLLFLPFLLAPYRKGYTIMSTHPYLNAYLGLLKRLGFLKSKLILRECSSVFTRYSGLKKKSYSLAYRIGYLGADLVVCQTESMKSDFVAHNQFFPKKKVVVQGNPIDQQRILKSSEIVETDVLGYGNFLCAAGRLIPEKGFNTLLYAFATLIKIHPDLKLIILGEGTERQSLTSIINQLGIERSVVLKGWVQNPMPFFQGARACVMSSIKEGFPNVLLQMMLLNEHVICTRCAGGIDNIPGILTVPISDPASMAKAMALTLEQTIQTSQIPKIEYLNERSPRAYVEAMLNAI